MSNLEEVVQSLSRSINVIADPSNTTEDKIDEIENALRDVQTAFQMIVDALRPLSR
jgi:hypothetical protein